MTSPTASLDDLVRVFNTAVIATRTDALRDFSAELHGLIESPAFRAILNSVRHLARTHGLSEREAAESVIKTFRKMDQIWGEYVFQEGVDRLRNNTPQT